MESELCVNARQAKPKAKYFFCICNQVQGLIF